MSNRRQWMVVGGIVGVLAIGLFVATQTLGAELFPLNIGAKAPNFEAKTLTVAATPKGIDDYKGQVVLLNIWATWCGPCRIEMPSMQKLEEAFGPKGLRIVAVSVDDPGMEGKITSFAEELKLSFEILHDAPGRIRTQYQTTGVPETFIIGRDGTIRRRVIGADDWNSEPNRAFIAQLLAEPAP